MKISIIEQAIDNCDTHDEKVRYNLVNLITFTGSVIYGTIEYIMNYDFRRY